MSVISRSLGAYRAAEIGNAVHGRLYKPTATRYGVLYTHGVGVNGDAVLAAPYRAQLDALTAAGYPIFSADFGASLSNFGNDDGITALGAGYTYLSTGPSNAKVGKVLLYGGSMGALPCLNWARQNPTLVKAVVLTIPALDLNDIYQNDKGGYRATVGTAYGVTYPTAIPGLSTHSPVSYPTNVTGFPIKLYASSNDSLASNTAACNTWAAAVGSNVTVVDMGAVGHAAAGNYDVNTVVSFFDANGGRS